MDEISAKFSELSTKCSNIDTCIDILSSGSSRTSKIKELSNEVREINSLKNSVLELSQNQIKIEYENTMKELQKTQLKMLYIMERIMEKEAQANKERRVLHEIFTPARKLDKDPAFSVGNTPKMYLDDYSKSPFTNKTKPVSLQFFDFEAEIFKDEFVKIPSYMRNRITVEELQEFLDNVVIKCFTEKYTLFHKKRSAVSNADRNLWIAYQEQKSYFNGEKFITQGDICRVINRMVDKKIENKLQMLRHLKILKEVRRNSTTCYMWIKKT